ncbi:MAG: helix-turn-helix transcriptional regulator [Lachnospiraceae bacterium]|nr:helix-turn-helix transcriptional regulator [Lachnospiraceae bacterium]
MLLPENITCGYWNCSEFDTLTHSPKRITAKFEIEYYLSNGQTTMADDKAYQIRADHIQIAKPGQVRHSILPFTTMFLKFTAEGALCDELMNAPEYFKACHAPEIKALLKEIILLQETISQNSLQFYSKLLALLSLILEDSRISQTQNARDYQIVADAQAYMTQHFSENIHLNDIAASANLSPTYFHNIFSTLCGMSPHAYLTDYRIKKAKEMLWHSENSICCIAEACGFGCQQYMNQVFKKNMGIAPGQYRKQMKQNYLL